MVEQKIREALEAADNLASLKEPPIKLRLKTAKLIEEALAALDDDGWAPPNDFRRFPMQDGPDITWGMAQAVYEVYAKLYGRQQSLKRLAERGGFGWEELQVLMKRLPPPPEQSDSSALKATGRLGSNGHGPIVIPEQSND